MNVMCPLCDSDQAERLVLSWSAGLSHFKANTVGIGFAVAEVGTFIKNMFLTLLAAVVWPIALPLVLFGFFKPLAMFARTWGTSQTVLSAETQPPYYFPFWRYVLRAMAVLFIALVAYGTVMGILQDARLYGVHYTAAERYRYLILVMGTVLLLISVVLTLGVLYNKRVWPLREAAWQRSFLCKRCGGIFLIPDYDPVGINPVSSRSIGKRELLPRVQTEQERHRVEGKALDFDEAVLRKRQGFWLRLKERWKYV